MKLVLEESNLWADKHGPRHLFLVDPTEFLRFSMVIIEPSGVAKRVTDRKCNTE